MFRPHHEKIGAFSSNYASVEGKNVVIIDDVVGSGETFISAINATTKEKGNPILLITILNKKKQDQIKKVPLRSLIRARVI